MNLSEVIFTDNLPTLDLHGYDRDSARVKLLEFINDKVLSHSKKVIEYKLFYRNNGMTIAKIDIDK